MRSPESSLNMRKSELSLEVKSYVENLTAQINEAPRALGFKTLQEMLDALDQDSAAFEADVVRRDQIIDAVEQLSKFIELRRRVKETGEIPEKNDPFDPDNWDPEDYKASAFLKKELSNIEEGKIKLFDQIIGGEDKYTLNGQLSNDEKIEVASLAKLIIFNDEFTTLEKPKHITLIRLTVADLGFPMGASTEQIYAKAKELGLEYCPAEVGPRYRLLFADQPLNETVCLGMNPLMRQGSSIPFIFSLEHDDRGIWLSAVDALPNSRRSSDDIFLFHLPKAKAPTV